MTDAVAKLKLDDDIVMQFGNKLYSQEIWWVILRELLQNALDSGANTIIVNSDGKTFLTVKDNGCGMSKEVLLDTFLTVGGSNKRERNVSTVGGFGIAKLAIFACDDFEVRSGKYLLTKNILSNHLPLEELENEREEGTKVTVKKAMLFSSTYGPISQMSKYLSLVRRDVKIIFNDTVIEEQKPKKYTISNYQKTAHALENFYDGAYVTVIVRANGLPIFREVHYGFNQNFLFIHDVSTDLDPYDNNYPFTMTRDGFNSNNTPEVTEWNKFNNALDEHFRKLKTMEEKKRELVIYDESTGYYRKYDAEINEDTIKIMERFKKYIILLYNLKNGYSITEPFGIGIMGNIPKESSHLSSTKSWHLSGGAYFYDRERKRPVYLISSIFNSDEHILGVAIHEFSHRSYEDHFDDFANEMTLNVIRVVGSLLSSR